MSHPENGSQSASQREPSTTVQQMVYRKGIVAGTFDRLHEGHKQLLDTAFRFGVPVFVGVTTDVYVENSDKIRKKYIQPYEERVENISNYANEKGISDLVTIFPLHDAIGPTLDPEEAFDFISVSAETLEGALLINQERQQRGLTPLDILVAPSVKGRSSTQERIAELNFLRRFYYRRLRGLKRRIL